MSRKKHELAKKKPSELADSDSRTVELNNNNDISTYINSTTETTENQGNTAQDDLKGRHFAYVVYPELDRTDAGYRSCVCNLTTSRQRHKSR